MTDTTDKALDALQERLKAHDSHPESASAQADAVIAALRAQLADAQAALDAAEIEHGITSNGNLWRFWSKKASDLAKGNTTLRAQLATARADAENHRKALQVLRPVWAHGWTDDSQAAQATAAALGQLWALLDATNQTDAARRLHALIGTPTPSAPSPLSLKSLEGVPQEERDRRRDAEFARRGWTQPSPEAVARAALEDARREAVNVANDIGNDQRHGGAMDVVDALSEMVRNDATIAAIVAKAGGGE
jgi:hypothetical protein